MQDFSVEGSRPNVWGSVFLSSGENFTIVRARFGNVSIVCIKIIKRMKKLRRNFQKMQIFMENFIFARVMGKNKNYHMHRL